MCFIFFYSRIEKNSRNNNANHWIEKSVNRIQINSVNQSTILHLEFVISTCWPVVSLSVVCVQFFSNFFSLRLNEKAFKKFNWKCNCFICTYFYGIEVHTWSVQYCECFRFIYLLWCRFAFEFVATVKKYGGGEGGGRVGEEGERDALAQRK